jgi:hypothetical protein
MHALRASWETNRELGPWPGAHVSTVADEMQCSEWSAHRAMKAAVMNGVRVDKRAAPRGPFNGRRGKRVQLWYIEPGCTFVSILAGVTGRC